MVGNGHDLFGAPPPADGPDDDVELAAILRTDSVRPAAPVSFWQAWLHRRRYVRPAGGFVGFGRVAVEQPDFFEATFRVGWWFWDICPANPAAGLIERLGSLQAAIATNYEILRGRLRP